MSKAKAVGLAAALILSLGAVLGGYAVGHSGAPNDADARRARVSAEQHAFSVAYRGADASAHTRGMADGRRRGKLRALKLAQKRGRVAGKAEAEERRLDAAAQAEAERQAAIAAQAAERAENCGAPLFVDGYCPTDEEVDYESQAESLCGGGDYEEARAQGVACFPPGDPRNP